jgi:hypothetical protein
MPRKTKREKILAEHRRIVTHTGTPSSSSYTFQTTGATEATTIKDTQELRVIQHDLIRTVILSIIAISVELGLYWKLNGTW